MLEECVVCYESYEYYDFQIYCRHHLCSLCYLAIFNIHSTARCPICRQPIQIERILIRRPIKKLNMRRFQNILTLTKYKYSLFKNKRRSKERNLRHKMLRLALGIATH